MTFKSHLSPVKVAVVSLWTSVSCVTDMLVTQVPKIEL